MEQLEYFTETHTTQIAGVGGEFAGFKRPCRGCGVYFRPARLNDDGHCDTCDGLTDAASDRCVDCGQPFGAGEPAPGFRCKQCAGEWPAAEDYRRWAASVADVVIRVLTGAPHEEALWTPSQLFEAARTAAHYAGEALRVEAAQ